MVPENLLVSVTEAMSFQPEPLDDEKRRLRSMIRERLANCTPEEAEAASQRIAERVERQIPPGFVGQLLAFFPTPKEPAVLDLLRKQFSHATFLLPRIASEELTLHAWTPDRPLVPNRYRIPEPSPDGPVSPHELEIALIPGLAFDAAGGRLGRGGGYYDRLLAKLPSTCLRIGLCFDFQLVDRVPRAPHDLPVHRVITDLREFAV